MTRIDLDALPPLDHPARRQRLAAAIADAGLDALLVTRVVNVRYLTGFTGSNGTLLLGADGDARFVTDGRYEVQAGEQVPDLPRTITRADDWLADAVTPGTRLGLESHAVSWDRATRLRERLDGREVVAAGEVVEPLRAIKDDAELARLRAAAAVTDAAFADLDGWVRKGRTEREVARFLADRYVAHGAAGAAFDTIVAAGEHSARPHHRPTDRELTDGDLVTIDTGALVDGYPSDMTRLVAVGDIAERLAEVVAVLTAAQEAGVAAVADGVACRDVDRACRDHLAAHDLAAAFVHGTGHGVGLELHEGPRVAPSSDATLAAGMVCTVEPGVYLPAVGGARIEDVVAVTADGAERLTHTPREVLRA